MIRIVTADGRQETEFLEELRGRSAQTDAAVTQTVSEILADVRARGEEAVRDYTRRFDGAAPAQFEIPRAQWEAAAAGSDPAFLAALERAAENIRAFHSRQVRQSFIDTQANGVLLGQRVRGLTRVGVYVPGGTAAYPSSVLMNVIPAKIAGVREIVMATPPSKDGSVNPDVLTAALVAGVDRVFAVGGSQAIAALAYGAGSIPRVDKIVGPGNIYVATAKKLVYGAVDIDMVAGPSEILILADSGANPEFLAADLLSQAEHDRLASSILITDDARIAQATAEALERQLAALPRAEIAAEALRNYGGIIVAPDMDTAVRLANEIAPEHLEVAAENPLTYIGRLDNAGSVFLGHYTPEPVGDYFAGPNHVLPTSGSARFFSPLSVDSFVKRSSFIYYPEEALRGAAADIERIARQEGLDAHANAVAVRFAEQEGKKR